MDFENRISMTKELLADYLTTGHALLLPYLIDEPVLRVARSMFVAASFNANNNEKINDLVLCAVSLELLRAGIENHYKMDVKTTDGIPDLYRARNLDIISADYYYAKAITVAAKLNRGDIISCLVGAIADVSEAEVLYRTAKDANELDEYFYEKNAGLFKAAFRMSELITGEVDNSISRILDRYALACSLLWRGSSIKNSSQSRIVTLNIESLKQTVLKELEFLPKPQRQELTNMLN
jgi:hypothetical protein